MEQLLTTSHPVICIKSHKTLSFSQTTPFLRIYPKGKLQSRKRAKCIKMFIAALPTSANKRNSLHASQWSAQSLGRKTVFLGAPTTVWKRPQAQIREWISHVLGEGQTPAEHKPLTLLYVQSPFRPWDNRGTSKLQKGHFKK